MPMKWVEPDEFLTENGPHGDVDVYHSYKDDDYSRPHTFHYTLSVIDEDEHTFDARDLKAWDSPDIAQTTREAAGDGDTGAIAQIVRLAIRTGELKDPKE
jgi:hypothetical protein